MSKLLLPKAYQKAPEPIKRIHTDDISFSPGTLPLLETLFFEIVERGGIFVYKATEKKLVEGKTYEVTEMYETVNKSGKTKNNYIGLMTPEEQKILKEKARLFHNGVGFWHTHPTGKTELSKADETFLYSARALGPTWTTDPLIMIIAGDNLVIYK